MELVEQQLLEMHKGKQLSAKGASQKERVYSRAWKTFAYSHVAAILEELVNAIVGPKAAPSQKVKWNEQVEIATHSLVEVVAWEQGVLEDNKTTAKDWMGKAARAGGCKDEEEEEELPAACAKRPRRGGAK